MTEGVDYSTKPFLTADQLKAAGKSFVVRYLTTDHRGISAAEYANLKAGGIEVAVVYEGTANRMLGGRIAGKEDAAYAKAQLALVGLPERMPIYFACDFDATVPEMAVVDQYLGGCTEIIGLEFTGVYGGYRTIDHCKKADTARWFWQTYAWSGGATHPANHLYQYNNYGNSIAGIDVDYDRAMQENFGQASKFDVVIEPPTNPVPTIPWGPDGIGIHDLHGTPALAFYGEVTAVRNVPVHVSASKTSPAIATIQKGETGIARGTFRTKAARWVLVDCGDKGVGRAAYTGFSEKWPMP